MNQNIPDWGLAPGAPVTRADTGQSATVVWANHVTVCVDLLDGTRTRWPFEVITCTGGDRP